MFPLWLLRETLLEVLRRKHHLHSAFLRAYVACARPESSHEDSVDLLVSSV